MTVDGQLNLGMRCIKYLLCAINLLFVLTGVMIVSVGTTIYAVYDDFSYVLHPTYVSPATLLIIVGALIFIIAFFGCCGALKESTCMVLVFAVSLSLVLILELAAAVTAYASQSSIIHAVEENMANLMKGYPRQPYKDAIDFVQGNLQCCGAYSVRDWQELMPNNDNYLPLSCCRENFMSDDGKHCYTPYTIGCCDRIGVIINRSALYIGTAALAITLVQLTGIMFACVLGRAIRRQKTERERRRWELRENLINGYQPIGKSDLVASFPVVYTQPPIDPEKSSVIS